MLIHDSGDQQPLLIVMNLGITPVSEQSLKIPSCYGDFCTIDILITTSGGLLKLVADEIQIQLSAFTFMLGKLSKSLS